MPMSEAPENLFVTILGKCGKENQFPDSFDGYREARNHLWLYWGTNLPTSLSILPSELSWILRECNTPHTLHGFVPLRVELIL